MPYKSEAQRKYFNSPEGKKKIGPEEVEHWNEVSKGMKLPKKVEEDKEMNVLDKAIRSCDSPDVSSSDLLNLSSQIMNRLKNIESNIKYINSQEDRIENNSRLSDEEKNKQLKSLNNEIKTIYGYIDSIKSSLDNFKSKIKEY